MYRQSIPVTEIIRMRRDVFRHGILFYNTNKKLSSAILLVCRLKLVRLCLPTT